MTGPEELLSDTLRQRVDHRDVPSTPMSEVVGTARRIRRGRRIRNGVVAAVVVGVLATPFVIDAANRPGADPTPTDPSPTPAPHVRLADVALGEPPAVPWIDGSDYVAADGTRTTFPIDGVTNATPYQGGFLVSSYTNESGRLTLLDDQLREVWRTCGLPTMAVSQDRATTAYVAGGCRGTQQALHLGRTDGSGAEQTGPIGDFGPVGILDSRVVTSSMNEGPPNLVDLSGGTTPLDALRTAAGVEPQRGLVSGQLAGDDPAKRFAGAVVDARDGSVTWSERGWQLLAFSPDGSKVVGISNTGSDAWAVFDSETGEHLHEFALPAGFEFRRVAWEDEEHLLMVTTQGRTQAILRTTLDGAIQRATDATAYVRDTTDYRFRLAP